MNRDASPSSTSLQIARRLLAREAHPGRKGEPKTVGVALQRTCLRVSENLRDSMGLDGSNALLGRALARAEVHHPVLKDIRRLNEGGVHLDGVVASVETHGVAEVTAAIEALLAALVDILGRLIGDDMAVRLIDPSASQSHGGDGEPAP